MSEWEGPVVVVPLLLSSGYQVTTDLPVAAGLSGAPLHFAGPLGPDRHLARVMTARLREAGALFGDAVVLAAAGSEDPAAQDGAEQAAELLRSEWGPRVGLAFVPAAGPDVPATGSAVSVTGRELTAAGPDLPAAVEHLRQAGAKRVCVAPYVLLPGRFASRVTALASAAGATAVAPVLGRHRLVADLVVLRYREGLSALAASPRLVAGSLSYATADTTADTPSDESSYSGLAAQLLVSNQ
jgi:sirohydrochlorin ferrochelatase